MTKPITFYAENRGKNQYNTSQLTLHKLSQHFFKLLFSPNYYVNSPAVSVLSIFFNKALFVKSFSTLEDMSYFFESELRIFCIPYLEKSHFE